jgi:hypothetical protein
MSEMGPNIQMGWDIELLELTSSSDHFPALVGSFRRIGRSSSCSSEWNNAIFAKAPWLSPFFLAGAAADWLRSWMGGGRLGPARVIGRDIARFGFGGLPAAFELGCR